MRQLPGGACLSALLFSAVPAVTGRSLAEKRLFCAALVSGWTQCRLARRHNFSFLFVPLALVQSIWQPLLHDYPAFLWLFPLHS